MEADMACQSYTGDQNRKSAWQHEPLSPRLRSSHHLLNFCEEIHLSRVCFFALEVMHFKPSRKLEAPSTGLKPHALQEIWGSSPRSRTIHYS